MKLPHSDYITSAFIMLGIVLLLWYVATLVLSHTYKQEQQIKNDKLFDAGGCDNYERYNCR